MAKSQIPEGRKRFKITMDEEDISFLDNVANSLGTSRAKLASMAVKTFIRFLKRFFN